MTEHMSWHAERGEVEFPERSDTVDFEVDYEDSF
jgi:hypothetical protein